MGNVESSRSWFCVFNNPDTCYSGSYEDIAEKCLYDWIADKPTRSGAVAYCISADGLHHLHMVLEDSNKARFSAIKKTYPKAHIEPTMGSKEQAENYINKKGIYAEKGEQVLYIAKHGEIKGAQGSRKDLEIIDDLITSGLTPRQIFNANIRYRRYANMIKAAYFDKRSKDTPFMRDVKVYWHVGESGSGKSYVAYQLMLEHGEENVYFMSDYQNGGFDSYSGERILFLDEYRGQFTYPTLLGYLDKYKQEVHSRYSNVVSLWNEVHISSILPIEKIYDLMVADDNKRLDSINQLLRRITSVVYHYVENGEYKTYTVDSQNYVDYSTLVQDAHGGFLSASYTPFKN